MAERRIGLIMNGVTGRMGMNQHLIRSIAAIRAEGGVKLANGSFELLNPHASLDLNLPLYASVAGVDLSVLRKPFERYASSGEINTEVAALAPEEIETLKKEKLHLKDQLHQILIKASAKS